MKRLFFLIVLCCSASIYSYAQFDPTEDTRPVGCNNGIDDDGDGFIDCFDSECADETVCDGSYVGNDPGCTPPKTTKPKFTMTLDFQTDDQTANHLGRVVVGDLDRDGVPEMVTTNKFSQKILILNGATGAIKKQVSTTFGPSYEEIAIANLDNDNCAEIFVIDGSWNLYSYDCNLTQLWKISLPGDPGMIGIADFGSDGSAEIYVRDAIYDAKTGVEIIASAAKAAGRWDKTNGGPVAVDMNEDGNLDLVVGCTIYNVNLGSRTLHSGTLTTQNSLPQYFVKATTNATSVADFNLDGKLDVLASGSTIADGTNTTIFFWDPSNNKYYTFFDTSPGAYLPNGWKNGTGRINIADLDGDNLLDISYVEGKFLYAVGFDGTNLVKKSWAPIVVNEETSGYTGCTLFDFNGDGQSEIVYRDEKNLYIINGVDGSIYSQQTCVSRTNREYPIVADVDADGSTEICVTCRTVDFYPGIDAATGVANDYEDFNNIARSQYSQVRVFKSASEPWVPARRVWNQHGYFNVNINDDLTIPLHQQLHHKKFSTYACQAGDPPIEHRPLNSFLNQSPYIDVKGCPQFAAPNIVFNGNMSVTNPTCPQTDFAISFDIKNIGDLALNGNFPISFYKGDPSVATSTKLNTEKFLISDFRKGQVKTISTTVKGDGSAFKLYIVLNDMGTTVPPITLPNSNIIDCPDDNITSVDVNPALANLQSGSTPDQRCLGSTAPANGTANAYVLMSDLSQNTTDFTFYWSNGNTVNNPVDKGPLLGGLASGQYTVYAIAKAASCGSDTVVVSVGTSTPADPTANINELHAYTNCKNPDGKFDVIVNGGDDPSKYSFKWYETNDFLTGTVLSVDHIIDVLKNVDYKVYVVDKRTGCNTNASKTPTDLTPKYKLTLTPTNIDCSNTNNGSVASSLNILSGTVTPQYFWYVGNKVKPGGTDPALGSGPSIGPVGANNYTAFVSDQTSGCNSDTVTTTVGQTLPPVITATSKNDQSSCNPSAPNGQASASVDDQTKYNTQWYNGQGTGGTVVAGSTDLYTITGLKKGYYTIEIKDKITKCTATAQVFVDDAIQTLSITPAPVNNTSCGVKTGSISVNGLPGVDTDYTFFLDNGTSVIQQVGNHIFSSLDAGSYSVWAVNNSTTCESNTAPTSIVSVITPISITEKIVPASDCKSAKGTVTLTASGNASGNFKFEWFDGADTSGPQLTNPTHTQVSAATDSILRVYGNYTVKITDLDNGCSSESQHFIGIANNHKLIASKIDIDKCAPLTGGTINADLTITTKIPGYSQSDYSIFVYKASKDPDPKGTLGSPFVYSTTGSGPDTLNTYSFTNFTDDFYTVVAVSNRPPTDGCRVSSTVKLNRVTTNPIVNRTVTPNTFCVYDVNTGVINGNGTITLQLGATGTDAANDYSYVWKKTSEVPVVTLAQPGANLPGPTFEAASSLSPGIYSVAVTYSNPAKPNEGCSITKSIPVGNSPQTIDVPNIIASVSNCNPANGFNPNTTPVTLNNITVDGSNVNLMDPNYTLEWHNSDGSLYAGAGNVNTLPAVLPADYFVKVTNTVTGCLQTKSFTVDNKIDKAGVDLVAFREEVRCLDPKGGMLRAKGFTSSGAADPFSYKWYNEPKPVNYYTLPSDYLPAIDSITNLPAAKYTVLAIDNNTNCWATDTYNVTPEYIPVIITANSSPLTQCDDVEVGTTEDDASLNASVIIPPNPPLGFTNKLNQNNFIFVWRINGVKQTSPQFATNSVSNVSKTELSKGAVTVMALDKTDTTGCRSAVIPVPVDTTRIYPNVSALPFQGVSNCNPSNPDGVATADVAGDQTNYIFDWFEGTPRPLVKPGFFKGPIVNGLKAETYTVVATDRLTGCKGLTTVTIDPDPKPVQLTGVTVLSNVTNCDPLPPNGSLQANVDSPGLYRYKWTRSDGVALPASDTTQIITDLDVLPSGVQYVVEVTNKVTLCTATASATILKQTVIPTFSFITKDASCDDDNGYVALVLTNQEEVDIDEITWDTTPPQTGPILNNVPAGEYTVHVLTRFGCPGDGKATINTDIHPHNFISANGDNKNSHFHIDCIENFHDNLVKIYNRAGTLVYEAEHYDNLETAFDGKSNKGVSLMGTNLPDGTYFYIIDKRDGSKRKAGYLEIVN